MNERQKAESEKHEKRQKSKFENNVFQISKVPCLCNFVFLLLGCVCIKIREEECKTYPNCLTLSVFFRTARRGVLAGLRRTLLQTPARAASSDADLRHNPQCSEEYEPCTDEGAISFAALDINEGTHPPGSTWRR